MKIISLCRVLITDYLNTGKSANKFVLYIIEKINTYKRNTISIFSIECDSVIG